VFDLAVRLAQYGQKTEGGKATRLLMFVFALDEALLKFEHKAPT
jgi:hypothetical protein